MNEPHHLTQAKPKPNHLVLVIDDDYDLQQVLRYVLEDLGYTVVIRGNGKDALDYLATIDPKPDLIILDLMMPIMTGREFLKIKAIDNKLQDIPVIIMSASVNLNIEFTDWNVLRKPFQIPDVVKMMTLFNL